MKKILVTGGNGYVGSSLVPALLTDGYSVRVLDANWFGEHLEGHDNLEVIEGDVRNLTGLRVDDVDHVVHLANVANDPAVELDQTLSWEVNVLATQQLIEKLVREGKAESFIFASSGSVYGVQDVEDVTEELALVPISAYNKTKMVAERVLLSYTDSIKVFCVRPATVCGVSPRMRLDVAVNMLAAQAVLNGKITVFGGDQTRPNIHIRDMVSVYQHFIESSNLESGCYNAGFENMSILDIANLVSQKVACEIEISESNDPRSYRQNSSKLEDTGFTPKYTVNNAIEEVVGALDTGKLRDHSNWYNVETMKGLDLG